MAGLLDAMNDPVMAMGMGLLSASGPSRMPVSLGQALGAGYGEFQQAQNMQAKRKFLDMQMQQEQMRMAEMQRQQQQQEAIRNFARQSVLSPQQQAIGAGGPTQAAADMIPNLKPRFDTEGFLGGMMGIDPMQAMQLRRDMTPKPIKLGEGDTLLDPTTYKPIASGAPKADSVPSAIKEYQFAVGQGFKGSFQDFVIQQKRAGAGQTNVFNNTKDDFKNERDLRNDFQGLPTTKAFREVQSAYDQIQTSIKQASPAGDLAAATKIMKILDPGSVVRESELGMAMAATGMTDRVGNYAQMLMSGQKLTPAQRIDFGNLATKLYDAATARYNQSASEYQGVASDYGLNPSRVAKPAPKSSAMSPDGWSAKRR